jgi:hypothetical protein
VYPEVEAWTVAKALSKPDLGVEEVEILTRRFDVAVAALG